MKRLLLATVAALALIAAAPASADPGNNNGCGEIITAGAGQGFGQSVSQAAKSGGFDDEIRFFCGHL